MTKGSDEVKTAVFLCLPSLAHAAAAEVRLLDEALQAPVELGGPRQLPMGAFEDAGSGSDAGACLLEGCASIATQFTTAFALGLVLGVGILSAGSEDAAPVVRTPEARPLTRRVSEPSSEARSPGLSLTFAF